MSLLHASPNLKIPLSLSYLSISSDTFDFDTAYTYALPPPLSPQLPFRNNKHEMAVAIMIINIFNQG
jgi:hypothetical protein